MPRSKNNVTILALYDRISVFHTLSPWLNGMHGGFKLTFTDDHQWCLSKDRNDHLIIVRRFLKPPVTDMPLLELLRQRYARIFFMNGNAGGGLHRPEVLPYVDRFYNKALFTDRTLYTKQLYGGELFTHDAHQRLGIVDNPSVITPAVPIELLKRIHNHWNIGVGAFPRRTWPQRAAVAAARTHFLGPRWSRLVVSQSSIVASAPFCLLPEQSYSIDVNARLGAPGYPTIRSHRDSLGKILDDAAATARWTVALNRVSPKQFFTDLQRSRITFSPFGWGEVCFRDFEAIRAGSLLLKPDMDHLQTWPNIYRPGITYVPVRWDGSDLAAKIQYYLDHSMERREIIAEAYRVLRQELAQLPERSAEILKELVNG